MKPVVERALSRGLGAKHSQGYGRFKVTDWNFGEPASKPAEPGAQTGSGFVSEHSHDVVTADIGSVPLPKGKYELPARLERVNRTWLVVLSSTQKIVVIEKAAWMQDGQAVNVGLDIQLAGKLPANINPNKLRPA